MLKLFESDDSHKLTESIGRTQADWMDEDPDNWDEGQLDDIITRYDVAAKYLNCKASDLVNIDNEDDNEEAYQTVINLIDDGDDGKDVDISNLDGLAGLYILPNGCKIVTTNEWGYGTIYIKKSDLNKILRDN